LNYHLQPTRLGFAVFDQLFLDYLALYCVKMRSLRVQVVSG
jgi:hypothetical protein